MNAIRENNPDLRIHPRLAAFLKKWGFKREGENNVEDLPCFTAVYNGKTFRAIFGLTGAFALLGRLPLGYIPDVSFSIPAAEKFMRNS